MEIPENYHGVWTGMLDDDGRTEGYPCTVELHANGGRTRYDQVTGRGSGTLQLTGTPFVLLEDYVGPRGGRLTWTLTMRLNEAEDLECHWRGKTAKQQARATLRRCAV